MGRDRPGARRASGLRVSSGDYGPPQRRPRGLRGHEEPVLDSGLLDLRAYPLDGVRGALGGHRGCGERTGAGRRDARRADHDARREPSDLRADGPPAEGAALATGGRSDLGCRRPHGGVLPFEFLDQPPCRGYLRNTRLRGPHGAVVSSVERRDPRALFRGQLCRGHRGTVRGGGASRHPADTARRGSDYRGSVRARIARRRRIRRRSPRFSHSPTLSPSPLRRSFVTETQTVPFVDLRLQHAQIAAEVASGFDRVLAEGSFILGPEVEAFENAFAEYSGVKHVVGVGNGTDAIELALVGGGIRPGDEVIIPANTFVATAEAVVRAGGVLRLVDCDDDFLIDVEEVAAAVSSSTRAVIGVHLYGQAAPMELLRQAIRSDVLLVEDAAQSQGARRNGVRAGGLADVAGTSFYPGKNLGAYGDGGAVLTSSAEVADHIRALRNHGGVRRYEHLAVGTNSR
ncbi:MAG: aminotransferase class I/II-fold pyridoxal phosphate-dependent enzyme, partial [Salinibacterium sp.]|nr:aminotransferase class I/II-fold pyridoxal phosphate-dependent enzyme [Salinibacterium sp.]